MDITGLDILVDGHFIHFVEEELKYYYTHKIMNCNSFSTLI